MIKLTCNTFMSFNNLFTFFFFFACIKMSKDSSAKYQNNKEILQKNLVKDIKVFLKKKKKTNGNMVVNDTKIYQMMKNKSLLSVEKNIIK